MTYSADKTDIMKEHSKIFVGNLLIKMYYPNVISFLVKNHGPEEAKARLFQIGKTVAQELLEVTKPKAKDVKKMIHTWYKLMWNTTKYVEPTIYRLSPNGIRTFE